MNNLNRRFRILAVGTVFLMSVVLPEGGIARRLSLGKMVEALGRQSVTVSTFAELRQAVIAANDGTGETTILLQDGTYQIPSGSGLYVTADNVTMRSLSEQGSFETETETEDAAESSVAC